MIRTENLTKEYNGFLAVDDLNLNVKKGEIYGFLGPNGAGKTTTILMLLGILKPTRGKVFLLDQELSLDPMLIKSKIGVVSENQYLYKDMTAKEYLDFFADLYQVPDRKKRIDRLLEEVNLMSVKNKPLETFSHGMRQKIGFARAFLHDPEILILDEPNSGLDPVGVKQVRDLISRENKKGKTVLISSHLLSEVEKLCGKVGIINKGKLLAEEKMDTLKKRLSDAAEVEIELVQAKPEIVEFLSSFDFVKGVDVEENRLTVKVKAHKDYRAPLSEAISKKGGIVLGIKTHEMSLEDAFITITQKNISLLTPTSKRPEV